MAVIPEEKPDLAELVHHGIPGMRWGFNKRGRRSRRGRSFTKASSESNSRFRVNPSVKSRLSRKKATVVLNTALGAAAVRTGAARSAKVLKSKAGGVKVSSIKSSKTTADGKNAVNKILNTEFTEYKSKSATAQVLDFGNGTASLSGIQSTERGKGHATDVLNDVLRWADERGIAMKLVAHAIGDDGLPQAELVKFYEKFGFVLDGDEVTDFAVMRRKPKN